MVTVRFLARHFGRGFAVCFAVGLVLQPVDAYAPPLAGLLVGLVSGLGFTGAALNLAVAFGVYGGGAVAFGASLGAFLAGVGGQALIGLAGSAIASLFAKKQQAPTIESARIVARVSVPTRWIHAGHAPGGGNAIFGEFDTDGGFWWVVIHSDSRLVEFERYILDEIPVEIDVNGWVLTDEFRKGQKASGANLIRLFTRTYTASDPTPPGVAELTAKFPEWTAEDHLLVGTTFTVGYMAPMTAAEANEARFSRGPIGVGEPSTVIVGEWDGIYDPRDVAQDIDDPATWGTSRNAVLIWAWFRTHPWGRNKPMTSINWTRIAEQADICDLIIEDRDGLTAPQYECATAIPDSKARVTAEAEIMGSCDGKIFFDDLGRAWLKAGAYVAPTVTLSEDRDIYAMASSAPQDGEAALDGVIVTYLDPRANFAEVPAAPWRNPLYYEAGRSPNYLSVTIQTVQNHRQAVQLAKAIGLRLQPAYRIAPTAGLRGLLLSEMDTVNLIYDQFDGIHEIASPLEEDRNGLVTQMGLVPIDGNRWTLLAGEEGVKPAYAVATSVDTTLSPPADGAWTLAAAPVPGSGGAAVRLEVTFSPPTRIDYTWGFEYQKDGETIWRPMVSLTEDGFGYSDIVEDGETYDVQVRVVTTSGRASDYGTPKTIVAIADTTVPDNLATASVTAGLGHFVATFVTPISANAPDRVAVYANRSGALNRVIDRIALTPTVGGQTVSYPYGDATRVNLLGDPSFDTGMGWVPVNATISGGAAVKVPTAAVGSIKRPVTLTAGLTYRWGADLISHPTGNFNVRIYGATAVNSGIFTLGAGARGSELIAPASPTDFGVIMTAPSEGQIGALYLYEKTLGTLARGVWQVWIEPQNASGVPGTLEGPFTISVI